MRKRHGKFRLNVGEVNILQNNYYFHSKQISFEKYRRVNGAVRRHYKHILINCSE